MSDLFEILNSFPYNVGAGQRAKLNVEPAIPKPQIVDPSAVFKLQRNQLINEALTSEDGNITLEQARAIAHWSMFGRQSIPSVTRAVAGRWKMEEFRKPMRAAWNIPIPPFQLGKLLNGFDPSKMEDKWYIYADGPDTSGRVVLHMYRSWTGNKNIELEIQAHGDKEDETEAWSAEVVAISWETDEELIKHPNEEMAKYEALETCNWCLGVKLVEEIVQPAEWDDLPTFLPTTGPTKTYRGATMSADELSDVREGDIVVMG